LITVDWSHTKDLTTYDGKKLRVETLKSLCDRITKLNGGESKKNVKSSLILQPLGNDVVAGESTTYLESKLSVQPATVIIEQGCPLTIAYSLILAGAEVFTISNRETEDYRKEHSIEKTDENDAKIIYYLANNGVKSQPLTLNDKIMQLHDLYHQYCRYQKARIAMQNMKKAHQRQYRGWESTHNIKSAFIFHQPLDLLPYDIAIDTLEAREKSLIKRLGETYKGLPLFEIIQKGILTMRL